MDITSSKSTLRKILQSNLAYTDFRHSTKFTYLNGVIPSPIRQEDELQWALAGRRSSWPDDQAHGFIRSTDYVNMVLQKTFGGMFLEELMVMLYYSSKSYKVKQNMVI